jgi:outer membrane protein TolC
VVTLKEAIARAEANEPTFRAAMADSQVAGQDRWIARTGLLPNAVYHNQAIYTQAGSAQGTGSPKFIAGNGVHEYMSQVVVNETAGLAGVADVRRADAAAARAKAELEVARRGLVAAVTGLYYGAEAADAKLAIAERAHGDAASFTSLTQKREEAREAAHADVVKAQLAEQQRERELRDAQLGAEKAHLELGVLLFPDPRSAYSLASPEPAGELPPKAAVEAEAARSNPELKSALAGLAVSNAEVLGARASYLPELGLNWTYGIDAPQFAVNGPDKVTNLGYSASATLDLPVWDWLATHSRVKQSEIKRDAAKVALTAAQRRVLAQLDEAYSEAAAARDELASLDRSVETAAESLRLTKMRYSEGEGTVFEVVDAENSYVDAENAQQDGRVRWELARTELEMLGGSL